MNSSSSPLLDTDQIAMLIDTGGNAAHQLLSELFQLFTEETGPRITLLQKAAAEDDFKTVAVQAHSIAGSSANLGGLRLSLLCRSVEMRILGEEVVDPNEIRLAVQIIPGLYQQTLVAFKAEVAKLA